MAAILTWVITDVHGIVSASCWGKLHIHQLWVGRLARAPASCPPPNSGRSTAVASPPQASLPPPSFQVPVNGNGASNGAAKQQPGWPSLDETAPKGGGKKRIVVLGTGKLLEGLVQLCNCTLVFCACGLWWLQRLQ